MFPSLIARPPHPPNGLDAIEDVLQRDAQVFGNHGEIRRRLRGGNLLLGQRESRQRWVFVEPSGSAFTKFVNEVRPVLKSLVKSANN